KEYKRNQQDKSSERVGKMPLERPMHSAPPATLADSRLALDYHLTVFSAKFRQVYNRQSSIKGPGRRRPGRPGGIVAGLAAEAFESPPYRDSAPRRRTGLARSAGHRVRRAAPLA